MKISEQALMEKEFPFYIYDKEGKIVKTEKVVMREIPAGVTSMLRRKSTVRGKDGSENTDTILFGRLLGAKMIIDAPFEAEDGTKWKDMDENQRVQFLSAISTNYETQIGNMMKQMLVPIAEEDENL